MKKLISIFFLLLNVVLVSANNIKLEKTRHKYLRANTISYMSTAFYPNPETEELTIFKVFHTIKNPKNKNYQFYNKDDNSEELFKNGIYSAIDHNEKTIYKFEKKENQLNALKSSRLELYGPVPLIKRDWKYEDETVIDGETKTHYSLVDEVRQFKGKTIKVEFHIYISQDYTITKFERKSYVDNKLGQTITYNYSNYVFSKQRKDLTLFLPENYSLKYYERIETLKPLDKNSTAPIFEVKDIYNLNFLFQGVSDRKKLFLFSSINCGASATVSKFINNPKFILNRNLELINLFGSDKTESVLKYFKDAKIPFTVIADQKNIETMYGIDGYPIMFMINENGIITETLNGSDEIINFLEKQE